MERVEWISTEELEVIGYGVKKKGDRFNVPDELAKQLIYQGLVKDAYVERKDKKEKEKKKTGGK